MSDHAVGASPPPGIEGDGALAAAVVRTLRGEPLAAVARELNLPAKVLELAATAFVDAGRRAVSLEAGIREEDRRRTIVQVAATLFSETGYQATKLEQVAEAMGLTRAAVYYYYPSKIDLFSAVIDKAIDAFGHSFERGVEQDDDIVSTLEAGIRDRLRSLLGENLVYYQVLLLEVGEQAEHVAERVAVIRRRDITALSTLLELGSERGEFRPLPPRLTAATLLGFLNSSARWYDPAKHDLEAVIEMITDIALRGVLVRG
jgi:AcrR family transcriptional regulator